MTLEHRHIETVIKSLRSAAAALERRRRLDVQKLRNVVEFLQIYADQRHHQREEALFFPVLVKRGVPSQGCPISGLNHEHEKGRALIWTLEESITFYEQQRPGADIELRQALQAIADLYEKHLWMEDAMVFPLAQKLVTAADNRELKKQFADLDQKIGLETIQRLEKFAETLSFQTGTPDSEHGENTALAARQPAGS